MVPMVLELPVAVVSSLRDDTCHHHLGVHLEVDMIFFTEHLWINAIHVFGFKVIWISPLILTTVNHCQKDIQKETCCFKCESLGDINFSDQTSGTAVKKNDEHCALRIFWGGNFHHFNGRALGYRLGVCVVLAP